jgi:CRP-like cAMP-binding protein
MVVLLTHFESKTLFITLSFYRMEELLKCLESFSPVPVELQIYLLHHLPKETIRAHKTILHEGDVCDWIAYVEKGLLKIYYTLDDGTERILWFQKDGDIIGSMKSYFTDTPSKLAIRTMEETKLRRIHKKDLEYLLDKYPSFNINARRITEFYYSQNEDHALLLTLPPKERLKKLEKDKTWLMQDPRIKDYMLAGYLGIDKTTLSKYRHEKE